MSQTFNVPMAGSVTLASSRGILNDALEALRSSFSGASAPTSPAPVAGQVYLNTSDSFVYIYTGSAWVKLAGPLGATAGTVLANGSVAFTAPQSMGSQKLTNLASGTATSDAINKGQVDAQRSVLAVRIGTISATLDAFVFAMGANAVISDVAILTTASLTSSGTDRWTVQLRNLTAAANLLSAAYDTDVDGDFTADARNALTPDQNLAITAGHVLEVQFTKFGSIGNLTDVVVLVEYTVPL